MSEWKEIPLDGLVKFQRGHDLTQSQMKGGKYPVAGSNGVIDYHNEYTTKGPGVTLGRSGNSIGVPHFYKSDFWAHNTTLYSKEFNNAEPLFVYYFLKTINFKVLNSGSAVPSLNRNHIHNIIVNVPPLNEQKAIASILSSLDDKIDLLHRQNATLKKMAETLFRQWFVEEAKEEWEDSTMSFIADFFNGKVRPNEEGVIPVYGGNGILGYTNEFNYSGKSIIIGRVGAYCGSVYYEDGKIWVSDNALLVKAKLDNSNHFLFYLLKSLDLNSMAEGSSHPLITQTLLKAIEIQLPPIERIKEFELQVENLNKKIKANQTQIRTLTTLRDTLLPKLMSGEVGVAAD